MAYVLLSMACLLYCVKCLQFTKDSSINSFSFTFSYFHICFLNFPFNFFKFQAFQRKIHENLAQLEMINKQYRRLARESRTDTNLQLRKMVHDANNRWDEVARRCKKVLRRMKDLLMQKEEFDSTRESMIVWLTEMDLQLTNVEHFSESDVSVKVNQMKVRTAK